MNDDKGFILSMDAVLMLIPIFIIVATVYSINISVPPESPNYKVQDAMSALYYADVNGTVAQKLASGDISGANTTVKKFGILSSFKSPYNLTYSVNGGSFKTLISYGTMTNSSTVVSSTRMYGNVTLKLYMWWG
jgi:archaellum component FlaF (FlaF/FlaG flagellin family)